VKIPWRRSNYTAKRRLDHLFLDLPDQVYRRATGREYLPPYSLRAFVGPADRFERAGQWFANELLRLELVTNGTRVLDMGCGSGRLALAFARSDQYQELEIEYLGMDIDRACIDWCTGHITTDHPNFRFVHSDLENPSYNPDGSSSSTDYQFPVEDGSIDLVIMTSVLTHVLEDDLRHYIAEVGRVLSPSGAAFVSFFLFDDDAEAKAGMERHGIAFPYLHGGVAFNREDHPGNAVAYRESLVRGLFADAGLTVREPVHYGTQDNVILERAAVP
jgi:ubiquinone/menaquinone biosynthesis C-methylase UbiE